MPQNPVSISELSDIIRRFFDSPELPITRATRADDVEEWDSLAHLDLIAEIEEIYAIRFMVAEMTSIKNVGELLDLINKKRGIN